MKHLLAITIALLPSPVFAQQFTPQQMLDVMTKSPSNRDMRVQDAAVAIPMYYSNLLPSSYGADRRQMFQGSDYD